MSIDNGNRGKLLGWYSQQHYDYLAESIKEQPTQVERYFIYDYVRQQHIPQSREVRRRAACIYSTPDGKEIICTEVCREGDTPVGKFTDYVCIGEVVRFLRPI